MPTDIALHGLREAIAQLQRDAREQESQLSEELSRLDPNYRDAGRNLAHYLALRQHDLRELQRSLAALGLSSLGRAEPCVMPTLAAVQHALLCLEGTSEGRGEAPPHIDFDAADALLKQHTEALLGPPTPGRAARIMLTLPAEAEVSGLEALLEDGADVIRINCAKGTREEWARTIERVRRAAERRGRECRILCDLAGPNPRTARVDDQDEAEVIGTFKVGDRLLLVSGESRRKLGDDGPVAFACTLPSIVGDLTPGERVYYDDGKLSGVVREVRPEGVLIELLFARKERVKLKVGKGLNFPDSTLRVPSLTPKDLQDLEFVARHADMVGLSFVRSVEHVEMLQHELERLDARGLGIVLKIETPQAFRELPRLLLTAMQSPHVGIMVARGDMAIEMGFERLAEAQEEILWLSEAAFVPVIWATQVLEGLNQTGVPSRAEVTDAAMAGRAECVMLNQGKHLLEASRFLRNVLERMEQHQQKKRSMLRRLRISTMS
jgi:pyruvate kinase